MDPYTLVLVAGVLLSVFAAALVWKTYDAYDTDEELAWLKLLAWVGALMVLLSLGVYITDRLA